MIFTMANWSLKETAGVPQTFMEYTKTQAFLKAMTLIFQYFNTDVFRWLKNSFTLWNWHSSDLIFLIFKLIRRQEYELPLPRGYWSALHPPLPTSPFFKICNRNNHSYYIPSNHSYLVQLTGTKLLQNCFAFQIH